MNILSVNAGSSSLKISLFKEINPDQTTEPVKLLTCSVSNISEPPAKFSFKLAGKPDVNTEGDIRDHASGFEQFLKHLESEADILSTTITHICHRVVHGGDYADPVLINDESFHHIERLSDLAPLHNGAALAVIHNCVKKVLPKAKSIAFFDSAFHRSIPSHISSYAIDQDIAKKKGLKKYGFHGLSYSFITHAISGALKKPAPNLILLHLGSGASACAVQDGKSLDTSMGLTPLNGLPGATRSGDIDPSLIFHYTSKAGRMSHDPKNTQAMHVTQAEMILNSKSGWKSLTGTTDFGLITTRAQQDSANDLLAFNLVADRVLNYIGSYHLKLGGKVDALVFAGGIGERSKELRKFIGQKVECLGYESIDESQNEAIDSAEGPVIALSSSSNKIPLYVCRTDEEFEMARQCAMHEAFC